eukprot:CAMPEP_0203840026 /NCGR_PEP_ID=MMETSP0359-20131031/532_1 /ASSEMBLY_ACC=CAM_ASM_000338 /TAXON_ID=268821 /ORGANISM="Scrippsiella Hangoei, Strain SHTV-5" /LENGTH=886 /DNA_ID=CAMNT_0050754167 /DNA_START=1 /DNA_END=2661 /DNA_ORIENTATION=+
MTMAVPAGAGLPDWAAPYAERLYDRYPEIFATLGHPSLPEAFHLPSSGHSCVEICELAERRVVRVSLVHRDCAPAPVSPGTGALETARLVGVADSRLEEDRPSDACQADLPSMLLLVGFRSPPVRPEVPRPPPACSPLCDFSELLDAIGGGGNEGIAMPEVSPVSVPNVSPGRHQEMHAAPEAAMCSEADAEGERACEPASPRSPGNFRPWGAKRGGGGGRVGGRGREGRFGVIAAETPQQRCRSPSGDDGSASATAAGDQAAALLPAAAAEACRSILCKSPGVADSRSISRTISIQPPVGPPQAATAARSSVPPHRAAASLSPVSRAKGAPLRAPGMFSNSEHSSTTASPFADSPRDFDDLHGTSFFLDGRVSVAPSSGSPSPLRLRPLAGSLSERRGVSLLALSQKEKESPAAESCQARSMSPAKGNRKRHRLQSGGLYCASPENSQSAVQLLGHHCSAPTAKATSRPGLFKSKSMPERSLVAALSVPIPRLLPGAFQNHRTIFFFDWDDTLCPTTWIRSLLKDTLADHEEWFHFPENPLHQVDWRDAIPPWFHQPLPDVPQIREYVEELQNAVISTINAAQAFGVVCIVTNAVPGWVEKTIKRWLPRLKQYIHGHGSRPPIRIIYGQQAYKECPQSFAHRSLPFVDELGEHMWWKHAAMRNALDEVDDLYRLNGLESPTDLPDHEVLASHLSWCSSASAKRIESVISVGDNEAEMQAATLACLGHGDNPRNSFSSSAAPGGRHDRVERVDSVGSVPSTSDGSGDFDSAMHGLNGTGDTKRVNGRRHSDAGTASASSPSRSPWVKLMKFRECSHIRQLRVQLDEVAELIPQLAAMRRNVRMDLDHGGCEEEPLSPRSPPELRESLLKVSDAELRADLRLRVQTA